MPQRIKPACVPGSVPNGHGQPDGRGTKVEMEMNSRPVTLFAKLMSPLSALMTGSMKKTMEKDVDELKAAAESAA